MFRKNHCFSARRVAVIMTVILISAFMVGSLTACSLFGDEADLLTSYNITATLDSEEKVLKATMSVSYYNNSPSELESIPFHLYPNAYRQTAELSPVSDLKIDEAYPNGISYGDITIDKLIVGDAEQTPNIGGDDQNILTVSLPSKLKSLGRVSIGMEFTVKLANIRHRLGYYGKTVNLGNWYPIAAAFTNGSFDTSPYCYIGDPFHSDIANYNVSIITPIDLTVAASGESVGSQMISGGEGNAELMKTTFKAEKMRDFAVVVGELTVVSDMVGNTRINYYYNADTRVEENMQTAVDALVTFNNLFGKYPYKTLSVVKTAFLQGGMEYPGLVYISDALNASSYTETIIHEIAHQWWGCVVGNNQNENAWLDEGLSEYSTALFYESNPSYNITLKQRMAGTLSGYMLYLEIHKHNGLDNTAMDRKLNEYSGEMEYSYLVYAQGEIMLNAIREMLGREVFIASLQNYYRDNKLKIASPSDLIQAFESTSNRELANYINSWLNGNTQAYA